MPINLKYVLTINYAKMFDYWLLFHFVIQTPFSCYTPEYISWHEFSYNHHRFGYQISKHSTNDPETSWRWFVTYFLRLYFTSLQYAISSTMNHRWLIVFMLRDRAFDPLLIIIHVPIRSNVSSYRPIRNNYSSVFPNTLSSNIKYLYLIL